MEGIPGQGLGLDLGDHAYLLDIIRPLGLTEWVVLSFSCLISIAGARLISYHFFTIAILTSVEDTLQPPSDTKTEDHYLDPAEYTEGDFAMASVTDDGHELDNDHDHESASFLARFDSVTKRVKTTSASTWAILGGTNCKTDELWGIQRYLVQERVGFPAIDIYIGWITTYYPFKVLSNSIMNGIVFVIHFLVQSLPDAKWEKTEFSKFPAWYEPLFVPLTAICGFVVTTLCAAMLVQMIRSIVYFERPYYKQPTTVRTYISMTFRDKRLLVAVALYAAASELTLNLPVLAVRKSALPLKVPWKEAINNDMISAIKMEWLVYSLLYIFLEVPTTVYLSRIATVCGNLEGDSIVWFKQIHSSKSYHDVMRGFGWKGWLRVGKMYIKMTVIMLLFLAISGSILSLELHIFGIFEESKLWFIARYLYFEGGNWEAVSICFFWLRVATRWS